MMMKIYGKSVNHHRLTDMVAVKLWLYFYISYLISVVPEFSLPLFISSLQTLLLDIFYPSTKIQFNCAMRWLRRSLRVYECDATQHQYDTVCCKKTTRKPRQVLSPPHK